MSHLPSISTGVGKALFVWCLIAITMSASIALNPVKFFRLLSWGRPLPKLIENRWVLTFYRVTGAGILIWVARMLFQLCASRIAH